MVNNRKGDSMKRICWYVVIALLVPFIVSCAPGYMIVREPISRPSEGKALVNFLRPSGYGGVAKATIWDGDKLIGMSFGKQRFQYECASGKHLFIAWSEYKSPVEAELLPGRVYYIVLRIRMGMWRGRIHQVPVNKQHPLWEKVLMWQQTVPNYTVDPKALVAAEAEGKPKILEYLKYYESKVKGTKHVLYVRPEDGIIIE